ncbi:MAG: AmmeMemoRadiSam system radical SAM enzyme, partial [Candidatus Binatota bacterium]
TLRRARQIALSAGIKYCYVGNVFDDEGQTTYCPSCSRSLIRRSWHDILEYHLQGDRCPCGENIPGYFPINEKATPRLGRRSILQA